MILNKTRNKLLSDKEQHCRNTLSKAIGLMFSLRPRTLVFSYRSERLIPLHMLFVFYPIDVVFLDKSMKVVEIKENFRPFTFFYPCHRAKYVIELPPKTVRNTRTSLGDVIEFRPKNNIFK